MKKGIKYNGIPSEEELQGSPCYPTEDIQKEKKVVIIECVQEIPCNPCEEACKFNAIYIGRPITNSYGSIVGLIFNIPLLLYLIPKYGIYGAAVATTLSYLVISIYLIWAFLVDQRDSVSLKNLLLIKKQDIKDLKLWSFPV